MTDHVLPTAADVQDAHERLRAWVLETPVLESRALNDAAGARVLVKAECLQHSGSFKIRGAMNRLLQLSADERAAGVVAFSSGNHAQAVALAAHWLNVPACIVMPSDAPAVKIEGTRAWGAEVVLYDRQREDREAIGRALAVEKGAALVPPFDHAHVIAGQGTAALELGHSVAARGSSLNALYVPCSGGGLAAGSALAIKSLFPSCDVFVVEPEGYDDTAQSLEAGERRAVDAAASSICDGLRVPMPGALTFAINRQLLAGGLAVDDAAVLRAMAFAARHLKVVLEPSGAAALAGVIAHARSRGEVGVILSGGNVDISVLVHALAAIP
jgi:threonine dehydratase